MNDTKSGGSREGLRIGVYVCHCGTNIAGTVDVAGVARHAAGLPGVVVARDYKFLCSDPGQELIVKDIAAQSLGRVVVASCSPRMHEPTFRGACSRAGLNPFLMTMANIREQCSWVTGDRRAATAKAMALLSGAVARVAELKPLSVKSVPVNPSVLVIGGGIAGIQAALDVAAAGRKAYLVEKSPSIGGHMAQFDKTFPTLDCAACILTPKMVSAGQSKNVELMTFSEVEKVSGYIGNFSIGVRGKSRCVDEDKCNGCGACWGACPVRATPRRRRVMLGGKPIRPAGALRETVKAPERPGRAAALEKIRKEFEKRSAEKHEGDCSLCGLCVRVCRDIVGASVLGIGKGDPEGKGRGIYVQNGARCIDCGACAGVCHTGHVAVLPADESGNPLPKAAIQLHELMLGPDAAIAIPFMQAVPAVPVVDRDLCIRFKTGGCGVCAEVCEKAAIDHNAPDRHSEFEVGSIVTATGFAPMDPAPIVQYGHGRLKNVITALEFEKLNNASGPTGGKVLMENGEPPESVALIHCVGSRDANRHEYCSRVCCMMALKYAHLVHEKTGAAVYDFFIDMRCFGKGYEEFYNRLLEEGVFFIRGRAAEVSDFAIYEAERGKLVVRCEDTLVGALRRIPVDMVVLMTALEPARDAADVARLLALSRSKDGFFLEQHPKLAPVATPTAGVFIAGTCQGPKDIPDTVAQASAAAAGAIALSVRGNVEIEPVTCAIDPDRCSGCRLCNTLCPFTAIIFDPAKEISAINDAVCKGCGTCAAACPGGAIEAGHFSDRQILAEIEGVCT